MLAHREKAAALEIVLGAKDPEDFPIVNDRLCRQFPNIVTDDLSGEKPASGSWQKRRSWRPTRDRGSSNDRESARVSRPT